MPANMPVQDDSISEKSHSQLLQDAGMYVFMDDVTSESMKPIIEWILVENHVTKKKKKPEPEPTGGDDGTGEDDAVFPPRASPHHHESHGERAEDREHPQSTAGVHDAEMHVSQDDLVTLPVRLETEGLERERADHRGDQRLEPRDDQRGGVRGRLTRTRAVTRRPASRTSSTS